MGTKVNYYTDAYYGIIPPSTVKSSSSTEDVSGVACAPSREAIEVPLRWSCQMERGKHVKYAEYQVNQSTQPCTVIVGYCDTVGEWQKCHNIRLSL